MSDASTSVGLLMAVVLIPLAWSGFVRAARSARDGAVPQDHTEKRLLAIMLAPVVSAPLLLCWAALAPAREIAAGAGLPIAVLPAMIAPAPEAARPDWLAVAMAVLAAVYACGAAFGTCRLFAARGRHERLVEQGERHRDWSDVILVDMPMSAFALGRGVIVLSRGFAAIVGEEHIALTVAHERAHIRRKDPRYYAFLAWVEVVFWFNPFVRAQTRDCRLAAELACDAAVIAAAPSMRKAYAATIVAALQHAAGDALACAPAAISPRNLGDHGMRIGEIMSPSRSRGKRARTAFVLAAVLALPAGALQLAYAQAASGKTPFMMLPLSGRISAGFGQMLDPITGKQRFHDAVDIVGQEGAPIVAPAAGVVAHVYPHYGRYGEFLEIDHGHGLVTRYAHMQSIEVREGQHVEAGQLIARVGSTGSSTGPHLHLQVLRDGKSIDPAEVFDLKRK